MLLELKVTFDESSTEPKYAQLARFLEEYLREAKLPKGTRLPNERQLAKHFGVTCVTVNRSLNELAQRGLVRRKVGSGTYVGDPLENLRIGVVCHEPFSTSDYYTGKVLKAFHQYWIERADLIFMIKRPEEYERVIADYHLSGLLILSAQEDFAPAIKALSEKGFPVVSVGAALESLAGMSFGTDHQQSCRQAVKYLANRGCRRIGMVSSDYWKTAVAERERGYTKGMYEAGLPVDPDWIVRKKHPGDSFPSEQLLKLMTREDRPDAFLIAAHYDVLPFYDLMGKLGLSIPKDVSVICFDDPEYASHLTPPLTVFRQPIEEISHQAALQLESMIFQGKTKNFAACEAILVERESCC